MVRSLLTGFLAALVLGITLGAASSLIVSDDEIRIVVPIEIEGASDALIDKWMNAIDDAWNRGNGGQAFTYCGRPVRFVPILKAMSASGTVDRGYHFLQVQPAQPASSSFVSNVMHQPGKRPTEENRNGFIASSENVATVAHEFGHYLGLGDEYYEQDTNRNGQRDPGEPTVPNTALHGDAGESLMATLTGHVTQRLVDAALVEHGIEQKLTCPVEILVRGIYTTQPVGGCNGDRATIEARVTAQRSPAGVRGSGPLTVSWRALNRCEGTLYCCYRPIAGAESTLTLDAADDLRTGHRVTVTTSAKHESLFTDGRRIGTGNFLSQWPTVVKGTNVSGTLSAFNVLTGEWHSGSVFRFENRTGELGPGGSMRLAGSGTVEVCPSSTRGPFQGCTTGH
jgi:hypothetical protein